MSKMGNPKAKKSLEIINKFNSFYFTICMINRNLLRSEL